MVVFSHTPSVDAPTPTTIPTTPTDPNRKDFVLEVIACPEATACVMNVIGETGLLGKQVAIWLGSYQAPSAHHYSCRLEMRKGERAAVFLEETLRNAEYVLLLNAYKKEGSPYLSGTLVVDGEDITVKMFEMLLAVPRGIKVDWCEKVSRGLDV